MRFDTAKELFQYAVGQGLANSEGHAKGQVMQWQARKRCMFSPEEQKVIGQQHKDKNWDEYLRLISHVWLDEKEGNPRQHTIIIVDALLLGWANGFASELDPIGGENTFGGPGLSESGRPPAQAYGCGWNLSQREYEYIEEAFGNNPDTAIYFDWRQALEDMDLQEIVEEPIIERSEIQTPEREEEI